MERLKKWSSPSSRSETVNNMNVPSADKNKWGAEVVFHTQEQFNVLNERKLKKIVSLILIFLFTVIISGCSIRCLDKKECGGYCYDPSSGYTCCNNVIIDLNPRSGQGCCNGHPYFRNEGCCDGVVYQASTHNCCNGVVYDTSTHICCNNAIMDKSTYFCHCCYDGKEVPVPYGKIICSGVFYDMNLYGCCNGKVYLDATHGCCNNVIYDKSTHYCEIILYPRSWEWIHSGLLFRMRCTLQQSNRFTLQTWMWRPNPRTNPIIRTGIIPSVRSAAMGILTTLSPFG